MEEVCRSGAHAGACHAQMYVMGSVLRHGSDAQKQKYLPAIAAGDLRLQSFGLLSQRRAPIPPASKPLLEEMATIM